MSNWPMIRGDSGYSGFSRAKIKPPLRLRWKARIALPRHSILALDRLFFIGEKGVRCFDLVSGNSLWEMRATLFGRITVSDIAYADQKIILKARDTFYCLDAKSGELVWQNADLGPGGIGPDWNLCIQNNWIYANRMAIDLETGQVTRDFSKSLPEHITQIMATSFGLVYSNGPRKEMCLFSPEEEEIVWKTSFAAGVSSLVASKDMLFGRIFDSERENHYMVGWSTNDGSRIWVSEIPVGGKGGGHSFAVNPDAGLISAPAMLENNQYSICLISTSAGDLVWRLDAPFCATGHPAVMTPDILWSFGLASSDRKSTPWLAGIEIATGQKCWQVKCPDFVEHLIVAQDVLVITGEKGIFVYECGE